MHKSIKIYKVLSYILLPIGYLFGFFDVLFLLSAIANPEALIFVFAIASLVFYIFLSHRFYQKGILSEQPFSSKTKDWIKVNAIVSLILCTLFLLNGLSILATSDAKLLQFIEEKAKVTPGIPFDFNMNLLVDITKKVSAVLLLTGFVGLPHVILTFRFLKQFSYLFEETL
jgi:amino acid permease